MSSSLPHRQYLRLWFSRWVRATLTWLLLFGTLASFFLLGYYTLNTSTGGRIALSILFILVGGLMLARGVFYINKHMPQYGTPLLAYVVSTLHAQLDMCAFIGWLCSVRCFVCVCVCVCFFDNHPAWESLREFLPVHARIDLPDHGWFDGLIHSLIHSLILSFMKSHVAQFHALVCFRMCCRGQVILLIRFVFFSHFFGTLISHDTGARFK
jgi:hypothetical protein